MKRVYIYVNGILTWPGDSKNWNGRAVTWTHINSEAKAEKCEYWVGPISRAFGQKKRAEKLYVTSTYYRTWEQIIVGHSNGADVILSAMRDWPDFPHVSALHLVCGATNADFQKNMLNFFLLLGRIDRVYVYVAGNDRALRLAHTIPGKILGYGTMGLGHYLNIDARVKDRVSVINAGKWKHYGHSDCWKDENFDETMRHFVI